MILKPIAYKNILLLVLSALIGISIPEISLSQSAWMSTLPTIEDVAQDPYRSEFFRVSGSPNLTVHTLSGDIEVVHNPGIDGVQIDLFAKKEFSLWPGSSNFDDYRIIIQKRGSNTIIATVEDKRSRQSLRSGDNIEFTFLVQVPKRVSLNLRSAHGEILVDDVEGQHYVQNHAGNLSLNRMKGEIRVVSTAGDIELNELEGSIYAKTIAGDIYATDNRGEVRLRTTSGNIRTLDISGALVAASTSGNITSEMREVSEGIFMETISGNIDLKLPVGIGYDIEAQGIDFDFDGLGNRGVVRNIEFRDANVTVREGGIPIHISTVAGSVKVRE